MAKYVAYPEYKDSGVEWLGDVPKHWVVGRYKFCTDRIVVGIAEAATHAYADDGVPIIRSTNIREKGLDTNGLLYIKEEFAEQNESKYLYTDDIITVRTGFPGVSSVIPKALDRSQCFTNLVATPKQSFVSEFLAHYLNSHTGKSYFDLLGWGSAQKNISVPILQNIPIAYPSLGEQKTILTFLDHETAKIDTLIEEQQSLIRLLKEKRQAVISHAVTKGLPSITGADAPMKDSGVEWLGEVPEHWEVKPVRHLGTCQNGINIGAESFGSGYPFISYGDAYNNRVLPEVPSGLVQSSPEDRERYSLLPGDILFTRTSETIDEIGFASVCLREIKDACFAGFLIRLRPSGSALDAHFSKYYFSNELLRAFFIKEMNLVTRASLSQDLLKLMSVALPPRDEQRKIAAYLDEKTKLFDQMEVDGEFQIHLLKERRTALISAAVTGKIDVRNWVAPS